MPHSLFAAYERTNTQYVVHTSLHWLRWIKYTKPGAGPASKNNILQDVPHNQGNAVFLAPSQLKVLVFVLVVGTPKGSLSPYSASSLFLARLGPIRLASFPLSSCVLHAPHACPLHTHMDKQPRDQLDCDLGRSETGEGKCRETEYLEREANIH